MSIGRLLALPEQTKVMNDLMLEIEEREVPLLDKATEMILKSIEVWNNAKEEVQPIDSAIVSTEPNVLQDKNLCSTG